MLPAESTAICGVKEKSELLETFLGAEKVNWASAEPQNIKKPRTAATASCPQRLRETMTNPPMRASIGLGTRALKSRDSRIHRASCLLASPAGTIGWLMRRLNWTGLPTEEEQPEGKRKF